MADIFFGQVLAFEDVAQVTAALGASYFCAHAVFIWISLDCALYLVIKTRPAASGFKFLFGSV